MSYFADMFVEEYYQQQVEQRLRRIAAMRRMLTMDNVRTAVEVESTWPTLPAPVVVSASVAAPGIDPNHPIFGELASRQYATEIAPDEGRGRHGVGAVVDFFMNPVRDVVRVGTTAWDALWNEAVSRPFKTTLAVMGLTDQGRMGVVEAWQKAGGNYATDAIIRAFKDPIGNFTPLPTKSDEAQVNIGTGFVPRSTPNAPGGTGALITEEYRPAEQLTRNHRAITPGRFVADWTWLEPESGAYNFLAGALDFSAMVVADPATALLKYGSAARAAHWAIGANAADPFRAAQTLAKLPDWAHGPVAGLIYRQARKNIKATAPEAFIARVDGQRLIRFLEEGQPTLDDIASVFAKNPHGIDRRFLASLVGLKKGEAGQKILEYLRSGGMPSVPRVGRISSGLGGAIGGLEGAVSGAGSAMRRWAVNNNSGLDRLFRQMGNGSLALENIDAGFWQLHRFLHNIGFEKDLTNGWLTRWANMDDVTKGDEAFHIVTEIKTATADKIRKAWKDAGATDDTMRLVNEELRALDEVWNEHITNRAFWVTAGGEDSWFPNVAVRRVTATGEEVVVPDAMLMTETLQHGIPLPDMRRLRHALSPLRQKGFSNAMEGGLTHLPEKFYQSPFGENRFDLIMDPIMTNVWRPLTLLRAAWTERIFLDNSIRMMVDGLDTMFNHPAAAISWMLNDPKANWLTRALVKLPIAKIEVRGALSANVGAVLDKIADGTIDEGLFRLSFAREYRDAMSARDADALLGISPGKRPGRVTGWTRVGRHSPGGPRGMVHEFLELADEPLIQQIAALGPDGAFEWLMRDPAGQEYRKMMFERHRTYTGERYNAAARMGPWAEAALDPEYLRAVVNSWNARLIEKTGGQVELYFNRGTASAPRWEKVNRTNLEPDVVEALRWKPHKGIVPEWERIRYVEKAPGDENLLAAIRDGFFKDSKGKPHSLRGVHTSDYEKTRATLEAKFADGDWRDIGPDFVKTPQITPTSELDGMVRRFFRFFMTRPIDFANRSPAFRQYYWRRVEELLGFTDDIGREQLYAAAQKVNLDRTTLKRWRETIDGMKGRDGGVPAFAHHLDDTDWEEYVTAQAKAPNPATAAPGAVTDPYIPEVDPIPETVADRHAPPPPPAIRGLDELVATPPSFPELAVTGGDTVVLYRAQQNPGRGVPSWMENDPRYLAQKAAEGSWYTDSPEELEWYKNHFGEGNFTVETITVPAAEAEKWRVSNLPADHPAHGYSRRKDREFFVPPEARTAAQTAGRKLTPMESAMPDEVYQQILREGDWDTRRIVREVHERGGSLEDVVKAVNAQPTGGGMATIMIENALKDAGFDGVMFRGKRFMLGGLDETPTFAGPHELIPPSQQEPGDWLYASSDDAKHPWERPSGVSANVAGQPPIHAVPSTDPTLKKGKKGPRPTAKAKRAAEDLARKEADLQRARGITSVDHLARAYGLAGVEELLYAAGRKSNLADALRNIMPFAEAFYEITKTWSRLVWHNPAVLRRGQQAIEGGRGSGFFTTDPESGEELFNVPGGGLLSKVLFNSDMSLKNPTTWPGAIGALFGPEPAGASITLQGRVQGLNLVGGSVLPGFGPVVQMAASRFLPDHPGFDAIRDLILPYGEMDTETAGGLVNSVLPSWMKYAISSGMGGTAEQQRMKENLAIDVYKALILQSGANVDPIGNGNSLDQETLNAMAVRARKIAERLLAVRAFAAFTLPTPPAPRMYVIPDEERRKLTEAQADHIEGRVWYFQTLSQEWSAILQRNNQDESLATKEFITKYGVDPTLFATSKSVTIEPRPLTDEGDKWARSHRGLFEAAPFTAYYAHPDDKLSSDFSFDAYHAALKDDAKASLTLDQWRSRQQDMLGRLRYQVVKEEIDAALGPKASERKVLAMRMVRLALMNDHPGYRLPNVGVPQRPTLEMRIAELENVWPNHPELAESEAGKAVAEYLALRAKVIERANQLGVYGWQTSVDMGGLRDLLRQHAENLLARYPDFAYVYHLILEHELGDEAPNVALGGTNA